MPNEPMLEKVEEVTPQDKVAIAKRLILLELVSIFDDIANLLDATERLRIYGGDDEHIAAEIVGFVMRLATTGENKAQEDSHE
ncbi:TPA: hypothetical protein ACPZLH_000664 [Yersinia enterocolitica]